MCEDRTILGEPKLPYKCDDTFITKIQDKFIGTYKESSELKFRLSDSRVKFYLIQA